MVYACHSSIFQLNTPTCPAHFLCYIFLFSTNHYLTLYLFFLFVSYTSSERSYTPWRQGFSSVLFLAESPIPSARDTNGAPYLLMSGLNEWRQISDPVRLSSWYLADKWLNQLRYPELQTHIQSSAAFYTFSFLKL